MATRDCLELLATEQGLVHRIAALMGADCAGAGHGSLDSRSAEAALIYWSIAGPALGRNRENGPVFAATTASFRAEFSFFLSPRPANCHL